MEEQTIVDTTATDLDLQNAIEETLWSLDTVRVTKPLLEVRVHHEQATVSGVVSTRMIQEQVTEALSDLPGVTLDLVNDDELEYVAAYAVATDSRTRQIKPGYRLVSHNGLVQLLGKLSPEESAAAVEVIRGVKGVRGARVNG
jgi:osmotically-inducible protein OsmY